MITDEQVRYVVWKAATLLQQRCGNEEVYMYEYSHKGSYINDVYIHCVGGTLNAEVVRKVA